VKRLKRHILVTECSSWISWFAWYPVKCITAEGIYQVWLERVEYRYALIHGVYQFEYRLPQPNPSVGRRIPVNCARSRRRISYGS
jgi:hypothetical protein